MGLANGRGELADKSGNTYTGSFNKGRPTKPAEIDETLLKIISTPIEY